MSPWQAIAAKISPRRCDLLWLVGKGDRWGSFWPERFDQRLRAGLCWLRLALPPLVWRRVGVPDHPSPGQALHSAPIHPRQPGRLRACRWRSRHRSATTHETSAQKTGFDCATAIPSATPGQQKAISPRPAAAIAARDSALPGAERSLLIPVVDRHAPSETAFALLPADALNTRACITSPIATACCTPRTSIWSRSPRRSARRSTAMRPRRLERHYRVFAGAFADVDALVCYAMKANSNQARDRDAGAARRRRRRGLRRRAVARAGRRHSAGKDHVLRRRQDRARARARRRRTAFSASTSNSEPELELLAAIACAARAAPPISRSASIPTSMQRPTPRSRPARPRTSSAFRSAARARSMPAPPSSKACASPASTCISAARSPSSTRSATPSRCSPISCAMLRADGHAITPRRSRRRPRHSLPRGQRAAARPGRLCGGGQARDARPRLPADLRAGPPDRRQCRHPGHARALREARRGQDFRHRRCRDERSRPPDALRRAPRHPPGASEPAAGAPRIIADIVGPVCESGDFIALDRPIVGTAARRPPRHHDRRAPTARCRPEPTIAARWCPEVLVRADEWALVRPRVTAAGADRARPPAGVALSLALRASAITDSRPTGCLEPAALLRCCRCSNLSAAEIGLTETRVEIPLLPPGHGRH